MQRVAKACKALQSLAKRLASSVRGLLGFAGCIGRETPSLRRSPDGVPRGFDLSDTLGLVVRALWVGLLGGTRDVWVVRLLHGVVTLLTLPGAVHATVAAVVGEEEGPSSSQQAPVVT